MKLPRDLKGSDLIVLLARYGYKKVYQKGSHAKIKGPHGVAVIPMGVLRVGLLRGILGQVARQIGKTPQEVIEELFG